MISVIIIIIIIIIIAIVTIIISCTIIPQTYRYILDLDLSYRIFFKRVLLSVMSIVIVSVSVIAAVVVADIDIDYCSFRIL